MSPHSAPVHSARSVRCLRLPFIVLDFRHPRDLPCVGRPIRLVLEVHKFFCRNPGCSRKVFTERLPDFIEASSRLTKRLRTAVQDIGFATCGKGGEQLGGKLGMPISDVSMLWSLFLLPSPEIGQVRVVGVDDWSWRRGKRFGSILVNLFLRVFVKRQFSLLVVASEAGYHSSVLNNHNIL